jgi:hypothetical protein
MSCCGKKRQQFYSEQQETVKNKYFTDPFNKKEPAGQNFSATRTVVCFEYTGRTSLTARGAVSGKYYRFEGPGSQVIIDPKDKPSIRQVPHLKQVYS